MLLYISIYIYINLHYVICQKIVSYLCRKQWMKMGSWSGLSLGSLFKVGGTQIDAFLLLPFHSCREN